MAPILELHLKSLCFPAAKEPVLKDIHFAVEKGEFVAVAGKPASGKSIFLHTLTGAAMKFHGGVLDGTVSHCGREQKLSLIHIFSISSNVEINRASIIFVK